MSDRAKKSFEEGVGYWSNFLASMPKKQLLLSIFFGLFRIVVAASWPFILYRTIKNSASLPNSEIIMNIVLVSIILALGAIASQLQSKINIKVLKYSTLDLIHQIWVKMNGLSWQTFHKNNRVYYFDMLMVEVWRLRRGMSALLEYLIVNSIIAFVLSLFIIFISLPLFIVCFCGLILMVIGHYIATVKTRPFMKDFHHAWRVQHHWVAKTVDQFDLIKMDRGYDESATANLKNGAVFLESNSQMMLNQEKWRNINQTIGNFVRIGVFVIGLYWVKVGFVGLDDLLLTLLIVSIIQSNIAQLPGSLNSFVEAQEALKTISTFFDLEEENVDDAKSMVSFGAIETISIQNLCFKYDDKPIITNLNIDLQMGKVYLWKGYNGSGKSTAAHILLGLLQPNSGCLSINGKPINWTDLKQFRNRFTFLNQDSPIFMGSIKENILFGHNSPLQAWDKLKQSWLVDLIPVSGLAENRIVGERGEGLSGGESKRVALIRELLRSSELLILDEPLNHLDEFAINEIYREISNIKSKTILIIISHQTGFENIADEIKQF
ncbi:ABC transporter ATP-binding protein [Pedobacter changchengzhani]|uniref:ABC transporter ATP-binding protein n=1 Tax=Pedobacter changchengzhani TaxID=2529274 RepID=A0A4R5ML66_9SPHI|nr:ABC transporter ATP-binding protein [Pedobacter changchengzhani]TDG36497.1 ABC transporter ATP-binding protein [Pedobacter changchengzhani]